MSGLTGLFITYSVMYDSEVVMKSKILPDLTVIIGIKNLISETLTILSKSGVVEVSLNVIKKVNLTVVRNRVSSRHRNSTITLYIIPALITIVCILSFDACCIIITYSLIEVVLTNLMRQECCSLSGIKGIIILPLESILSKSLLFWSLVGNSNNLIETGHNYGIVGIYTVSILLCIAFTLSRYINLKRDERQLSVIGRRCIAIRIVTSRRTSLIIFIIPCRIGYYPIGSSPIVEVLLHLIPFHIERNRKDTVLNLVVLAIRIEGCLIGSSLD